MTEPRRSLLQRVGLCLTALPFAVFVTVMFSIGHRSIPALLAMLVASFCASVLVMKWAFFTRPEELKRKLPISSKELRRKAKEFYDNLPH
jgi:hypothetical protein